MNDDIMYRKTTPIEITVKGGLFPNSSLQLTMNWDSNIEDWIKTFKTILIYQTFCEDTVKELFED
jgi:hypothetical protein